jgi:hypothetical protein
VDLIGVVVSDANPPKMRGQGDKTSHSIGGDEKSVDYEVNPDSKAAFYAL